MTSRFIRSVIRAGLAGGLMAAVWTVAAWATPEPRPRPADLAVQAAGLAPPKVMPRPRPEGLAARRPDPSLSTKSVAVPLPAPGETPMGAAMDAMRAGNWERAFALAAGGGKIAEDVIEWHWLRAGRGDFDAAVAFLARRPDWPGLDYLRKRSEGKVPYRRRADEVLAFFDGAPPQTGAGMIVLAAAHEEQGEDARARALVIEAWRGFDLTPQDERYLLENYGDVLKVHHAARLDHLLWEGDAKGARRLMPRVSEDRRALAEARLALRAGAPGVDTLIERVPAALADDPGLAYERFLWRLEKGRRDGAAEVMLDRAGTAEALGRPALYGNWRRILARQAMRDGDAQKAYRLASAHGMSPDDGYAFSDLEWIAGYVALTYLDDPETALGHFRTFRGAVETPISLGRAGYWLGRAHEALGDDAAAQADYAFGAEYQTSFYGLLAAERAGLPMDPTLTGTAPRDDWRSASFARSSVLEAARLLHEAGEAEATERFLTHLAESLDSAEAAQLADVAFEWEEPHIALMIAKRVAYRGITIPHAYYPLVDLGLGRLPVPQELALAIARRESEFDPLVKSPAGAVGLMQVMPATARAVARELRIGYNARALQYDPVYNARLGVAYLDGLIERFGPNMVLVSAGYNAGPGRPERWMAERGDPRQGGVDPVDWIEHIPFRETRNYVMRVMESLPVYRARLSGRTEPIRLTDEMRAR